MIRQDDPIHSKVAKKLKQVAIEAFHGADRDNLTLKSVREKVEDALGLEKGILRSKEWKDETKTIIEHTVQQLLEAEEKEQEQKQSESDLSSDDDFLLSQTPHTTTSDKKKISKKRSQQSTDDVTSRRKRLKNKKISTCGEPRANNSHDRSSSEQEEKIIIRSHECNSSNFMPEKFVNSLPDLKVDLSYADDINEKQHIAECASRKEYLEHGSFKQEETEYVIGDKVQDKAVVKSRVKDEYSDITSLPLDSRVENSKEKDTSERKIRPNSELLLQNGAEDTLTSQSIAAYHDLAVTNKTIQPNEDEEAMDSDMSVVIDEEPPEKRKRKKNAQKGETIKAGKKAPKIEKKSSSDEEMLKKLQSQLRKCGVKTIWHFILKEYGEDTRAKIRHLQKALKEVGMQGRFSEARAREIKESRELMADLEAVKEGDMKWGLKRDNKHNVREQNEQEREFSVYENSDVEVDSAYGKEGFKGKNLRNNTLKRKSTFAVQQPRRRSTALDWLGDEESSEG